MTLRPPRLLEKQMFSGKDHLIFLGVSGVVSGKGMGYIIRKESTYSKRVDNGSCSCFTTLQAFLFGPSLESVEVCPRLFVPVFADLLDNLVLGQLGLDIVNRSVHEALHLFQTAAALRHLRDSDGCEVESLDWEVLGLDVRELAVDAHDHDACLVDNVRDDHRFSVVLSVRADSHPADFDVSHVFGGLVSYSAVEGVDFEVCNGRIARQSGVD